MKYGYHTYGREEGQTMYSKENKGEKGIVRENNYSI
jgi:hypothetical protein